MGGVDALHHPPDRGGAGGLTIAGTRADPGTSCRQQRFGQVRGLVTGLAEVTRPGQRRQHRDGQYRSQLVPHPTRPARVGQLPKQLPQRRDDLLAGTVGLGMRD